MASLEPKPTLYRGTTYRSRLEARWAVYLSHHPNVKDIHYEPALAARPGYLPDFVFLLNDYPVVLEVKPAEPSNEYLFSLRTILTPINNYQFILAAGSFFNQTPWLYLDFNRIVSLERTTLFNKYALAAANGYRFDLKYPEPKYHAAKVRKKRKRRP